MTVYTVHQPPLGKGENMPDPAHFAFVRDGFYVWGFVLSLLWMLRHRLWLVAVLFVAFSILLEAGMRYAGVPSGWRGLVFVALAFLVGLEGATLRRWTLGLRGYTNAGVVVAEDQDEAERRFFAKWQDGKRPPAAPTPPADSGVRIARSEPPDVIGSFPQPERRA